MIVFGHRGARGEAPENTLPGFRYAYGIGVRNFELDVRLTADHRLILLHDATVTRTIIGGQAVGTPAELTAAELGRLDARADFPDWPEPCPIPLFEDLLKELPGDVTLEVEIKRDDPARLEILAGILGPMLREYGVGPERATITSFDPAALDIARRLAPEYRRGYIGRYDSPDFLATAQELGCALACIPLATGSLEIVRAARTAGLYVTGWPGNTPEQLDTLLEWEVERTTSDVPTFTLAYLRERGALTKH